TDASITTRPGPEGFGPAIKEAVARPELSVVAEGGSISPPDGSSTALKLTVAPLTGLSSASRTIAKTWLELVRLPAALTPMTEGFACSDSFAGVLATNSMVRLAVVLSGSDAWIVANPAREDWISTVA